eukprot:5200769-Alexandrium_andersonii.AAC.1
MSGRKNCASPYCKTRGPRSAGVSGALRWATPFVSDLPGAAATRRINRPANASRTSPAPSAAM